MIMLTPDDAGYKAEVSAWNLAIANAPDFVAPVTSVDDVIEAVTFARERGLPVSVQAVGHGDDAVTGGLMISTRRLDAVTIDPVAKTAMIQAGVLWGDVIAAAAKDGLFPITGSSGTVSAVGLLLGGGLSPLARSHGMCSDYLENATVVTGSGDVLGVSRDSETDLFWLLRGGKKVPGIVTDVTVRLTDVQTLYGGGLHFEEKDIEAVLRAWVDWTGQADPRVTTSVLLAHFPDVDPIPPMFRGRRILSLRFAFPDPLPRANASPPPYARPRRSMSTISVRFRPRRSAAFTATRPCRCRSGPPARCSRTSTRTSCRPCSTWPDPRRTRRSRWWRFVRSARPRRATCPTAPRWPVDPRATC